MLAHTLAALILASAALAAPVAPSPSQPQPDLLLLPTDAPSLLRRSDPSTGGDLAWTVRQLELASAFSVKMGASRLATAERPWQTWRASVLREVAAGKLTLSTAGRKSGAKIVAAKTKAKDKASTKKTKKPSNRKTSTKETSAKRKSTKKEASTHKRSTKKTTTHKAKTTTTKSTNPAKSTAKTTKAAVITIKSATTIRRAATSVRAGANQLAQSLGAVVPVAATSSPVVVATPTAVAPVAATPTADTATTKKATATAVTTPRKSTTTTKKPTTVKHVTSTGSIWAQPTQYDTLAQWEDGFIDGGKYPWGAKNIAVVQGPPQSYYNLTLAAAQGITSCNDTLLAAIDANSEVAYTEAQQCPGTSLLTQAATIVDDTESALQVKYPKGSYSPSNGPVAGGIGGYSDRLAIGAAQNLTLEYSVFFPAGFDFVKGGKLPGLYGGRRACSGGSTAEDCFSTRLMFRTGGMGELYLYAPREKQVSSLCTLLPGLSFCNSVYGMSIGRGSWTFKTGVWTRLRQDIWLNTPGVADGGFNLFVDGELVLSNSETYYRNAPSSKVVAVGATPSNMTLIDYDSLPEDTNIPQGGFDVLPSELDGPADPLTDATGDDSAGDATTGLRRRARTSVDLAKRATVVGVPGFLGIMFDTFFGGSDVSYATKTTQYSYFKRFSLKIND